MQRLTCAVCSVCSLALLPVRPQPSLIHHRPTPKLLSSPVAPSTPPAPRPDTHCTPYDILTSSSSRQSSPPVGACGRALFPSPDCQPSNPRTCTGGSRNPRPSQQPQRRTTQERDLSPATNSLLTYHQIPQHGYTRTPWRPRHGQPIRAVQVGSAWYVSRTRMADAEAWVRACANNAAGESAVGKVLLVPVAIKHHTPSS